MHRQASDCGAAIANVRFPLRCGCKMPLHRHSRRTDARVVTEVGRCIPLLVELVLLEDVEGVRRQGGSKMVASLPRFVTGRVLCVSSEERLRDVPTENLEVTD